MEQNYGWHSSKICFRSAIFSYLYELCCSPKLFADDTSPFSVVTITNVNETAKKLNQDLENMSNKNGKGSFIFI